MDLNVLIMQSNRNVSMTCVRKLQQFVVELMFTDDTPAAISTFPTVSASGDLVSVSQSSGICDKQCPLYIYNAGVATRVRVVLADGGG